MIIMEKLTTYAEMFEDAIVHHTSAWELTTSDLNRIKTMIDMMCILDRSDYGPDSFDEFDKQYLFEFEDDSELFVTFKPSCGIKCEIIR